MAIRRPRPLPGYLTTLALYPVSVRRIRVGGIGFLQIPSRDGHPCLALRFGPSPPAEDLHLLTHNMPGTHEPRALPKRQGSSVLLIGERGADDSPSGIIPH